MCALRPVGQATRSKSASVERLRAANLSSDAYASGVMETKMLTGGRKPSPFLHKKVLTHFRVERMHDRTHFHPSPMLMPLHCPKNHR